LILLPIQSTAKSEQHSFETSILNGNLIVANNKILIIDKDRNSITNFLPNGEINNKKTYFTYLNEKIKFNGKLSSYSKSSGLIFFSHIHQAYFITDYSCENIIQKIQIPKHKIPTEIHFVHFSTLIMNYTAAKMITVFKNITENNILRSDMKYKREMSLIGLSNFEEMIFYNKIQKKIIFMNSQNEKTKEIILPKKIENIPIKVIELSRSIHVLPKSGKYIYKYDKSIYKWSKILINNFDRDYQDFEIVFDFSQEKYYILEKNGKVFITDGEKVEPAE